jgi:hypothetical protein
MSSPIHESICSAFASKIGFVIETLPTATQQKISMTLNQEYGGFRNRWTGSEKTPYLAIKIKNDTGWFKPKWILEVGFSESYNELCEDAKLWLEGNPEVSTVILVKFTEDPTYQRPISLDDDLGEIPSELDEIHDEDFISQGEYGPVFYKGYRWVGQISEAFLETWTRGEDGMAGRRDRENLLSPDNPQIQIQLEKFFNIPPGYNGTVCLNLENFRRLLQASIKELATFRCREMLEKRAECMGEGPADQEYQP